MTIAKMIGLLYVSLMIGLTMALAAASDATHLHALKSLEEGVRQAKLKKNDLAIRYLDQAVKADPNFVRAYLERARILKLTQQPLKALEDLRRVVDLDPSDCAAWRIMGDLYLQFRQKEDALLCYSQAYEFSASNKQVRGELKSLMESLHRDLGVSFDSLIDGSTLTAHELGRVISKPVVKQRAVLETESSPATKPDSHLEKIHAGSAGSPLIMDNLEESLIRLKKAVELEPDNAANHETLALIYQIMGRYQEAIEHYENVLKIIPTHVDTMIALGDIYSISLSDNKMGLYWYAMAIKNEKNEVRKRSIADRVSKLMAGR